MFEFISGIRGCYSTFVADGRDRTTKVVHDLYDFFASRSRFGRTFGGKRRGGNEVGG